MPKPPSSRRNRPETPQAIKKKRLIAKAIEFHNAGWTFAEIGRELGFGSSTISKWVKQYAPEAKANYGTHIPKDKVATEEIDDPLGEAIKRDLGIEADSINELDQDLAREMELKNLETRAASAATPAEKYQSWLVTHGIRLMRDGLGSLRAPKTVKELETLDGIISKHLGLDAKTGGGGSGPRLQIDIGVLNNHQASPNGAAVTDVPQVRVTMNAPQKQLGEDSLDTSDLLGQLIDANAEEIQEESPSGGAAEESDLDRN